MRAKPEATIDDLYRVRGKAELVNGEVVLMSPTGGLPSYAARQILISLTGYERRTTRRGYALGDNVGYIVNLPHRKSFCPDAAFYVGELSMKFLEGAPVFAVEVRSEGDYGPEAEREMASKRADYFAAGTMVVWDVNLTSAEIVRVYRSTEPATPTIYRRGEVAEAEPAVPGWTMSVDDLFPPTI
ncbi:MAG: Uma2 family endonuclease [Acidobacteria bacterium]|nr:Uma2 family endonuclease [Acidobacteriota bacterium]